eukprot:tig00020943_g16297.t1
MTEHAALEPPMMAPVGSEVDDALAALGLCLNKLKDVQAKGPATAQLTEKLESLRPIISGLKNRPPGNSPLHELNALTATLQEAGTDLGAYQQKSSIVKFFAASSWEEMCEAIASRAMRQKDALLQRLGNAPGIRNEQARTFWTKWFQDQFEVNILDFEKCFIEDFRPDIEVLKELKSVLSNQSFTVTQDAFDRAFPSGVQSTCDAMYQRRTAAEIRTLKELAEVVLKLNTNEDREREEAVARLERIARDEKIRKNLHQPSLVPGMVKVMQVQSVQALGKAAERDPKWQEFIREQGAIPYVVTLLADKDTSESASYALCFLSRRNQTNQKAIVAAGATGHLAHMLAQAANPHIAIKTIGYLAESPENHETLRSAGVVQLMVRLLSPDIDPQTQGFVAAALWYMTLNPATATMLTNCGVVPGIVRTLSSDDGLAVSNGVAALAHLTSHTPCRRAAAAAVLAGGGVHRLLVLLREQPDLKKSTAALNVLMHLVDAGSPSELKKNRDGATTGASNAAAPQAPFCSFSCINNCLDTVWAGRKGPPVGPIQILSAVVLADGLKTLVELTRSRQENLVKCATMVLARFSMEKDHRRRLVDAGGYDALSSVASTARDGEVAHVAQQAVRDLQAEKDKAASGASGGGMTAPGAKSISGPYPPSTQTSASSPSSLGLSSSAGAAASLPSVSSVALSVPGAVDSNQI